MTPHSKPAPWVREELLLLLSASATLAGLCVTVVALMKALGKPSGSATVADDLFAVCSLLFLATIYMIFWALKTKKPCLATLLVRTLDVVFLVALTLMTFAAFVMVYTVW
jgi:hypothetical protein